MRFWRFGKELFMESVKSKKIRVFTLVCLLAALAAAVARTVILTKIVEPDTGLYFANTTFGYAFDAAVLVLIAAVILCGRHIFKHTQGKSELKSDSTVTVFGSALCAFMFFSVFVYGIYSIWFTDKTMNAFATLQIILCLPCGFNHLMICAKERREKNNSQALLAMSVPVMFATRVIEVFMGVDTQINTSQRSLELLMLCGMMMFYLYEASFLVKNNNEEKGVTPFANYYLSGICTVVLTCITVVPYLLVSVFWVFEADFVIMDVLECCVMLYAVSRLIGEQK